MASSGHLDLLRWKVLLGDLVAELMQRLGAEWHPEETSTLEALRRVLPPGDAASHEAVLAFERDFGGLYLPNPGYDDWQDAGEYKLIGPWACSRRPGGPFRGGPGQETLGLIAVAYGLDDNVYFLDRDGRGWFHDTISDEQAVQVADRGVTLVAGLVLYAAMQGCPDHRVEGSHGVAFSERLGLPAIGVASGRLDRFWGDRDLLVVEAPVEMSAWHLPPDEGLRAPRQTTLAALTPKGKTRARPISALRSAT